MVVFMSLSNFQHIFIDLDYITEANWLRKLYIPVQWFILPFFYLHIHKILIQKKLSVGKWLFLFGPFFFIFFLHGIHFWHQHSATSIVLMPDYNEKGLLLYTNLASFIFNGAIIYDAIVTGEKSFSKISKKKKEYMTWLKAIIKLIIGVLSIGTLTILLILWLDLGTSYVVYPFFILISFTLYYIGYIGVNKATPQRNSRKITSDIEKNPFSTYHKINTFVVGEKMYLDSGLSLQDISDKFNLSTGYLSQLFNTNNKQNFNDYINVLRIETAKQKLLNKQYADYTIESIGLECGFKSKSNFYTAFKKFTGQTPAAFVKSNK